MPCEHCGKPCLNGRKLCRQHYMDPEVRLQYYTKFASHGEPTMEELEALIAERSKPENLPWWWRSEEERLRQQEEVRDGAPACRKIPRKRGRPPGP